MQYLKRWHKERPYGIRPKDLSLRMEISVQDARRLLQELVEDGYGQWSFVCLAKKSTRTTELFTLGKRDYERPPESKESLEKLIARFVREYDMATNCTLRENPRTKG